MKPRIQGRKSYRRLLRTARRLRRTAVEIHREHGWGTLLSRAASFLRRQYTHRGGWERQYARYRDRLGPDRETCRRAREQMVRLTSPPLVSLLVPGSSDPELVRVTADSLRAGEYPHWEFLPQGVERPLGGDDPRLLSLLPDEPLLPAARGDWFCLLAPGDTLEPEALTIACAQALEQDTDLVYTDEDLIDETGRVRGVHLKPGWSPEMLLSYPYTGGLTLIRRSLLEGRDDELLPWEEGGGHDLLLRAAEGARKVKRIPHVLYHRRLPAKGGCLLFPSFPAASATAVSRAMGRRGIGGRAVPGLIPGTCRVRPEITASSPVEIVIATKNQAARLARCVASVERHTKRTGFRITIVDHESDDPAVRELLASLPYRVITYTGSFNFSRMMNQAARETEGDFLLFLNDDTEVTANWLVTLREAISLPGVGIAGPKLLYPTGELQNAGLVLGVGKVAGHAFKYFPGDSAGYLASLAVMRNYSAIDGACFLVRREVFTGLGGFDERLPLHFQDVDLCLRAAAQGWRTVYTPFSVVYHEEEASGPRTVQTSEVELMMLRWGGLLEQDPLYHPSLTRRRENFEIEV